MLTVIALSFRLGVTFAKFNDNYVSKRCIINGCDLNCEFHEIWKFRSSDIWVRQIWPLDNNESKLYLFLYFHSWKR